MRNQKFEMTDSTLVLSIGVKIEIEELSRKKHRSETNARRIACVVVSPGAASPSTSPPSTPVSR